MKGGDTDGSPHAVLALFSKRRVNKNRLECFYCHKHGHITLDYKIKAKDLLKGRLKESASANIDFQKTHQMLYLMTLLVTMNLLNHLSDSSKIFIYWLCM